jgi:hypothetical protein
VSDKFIGYFQIVDACEQPGCPVCRCLDDGSRRDLAAILYEQVTDLDTRRALRDAWGFCNWHTWMLLEADTSLFGASILHEDLLRLAVERLARLGARPRSTDRGRPWRSLVSTLRSWFSRLGARPARPAIVEEHEGRPACSLCASAADTERHCLLTFLTFVEDGDLQAAYAASDAICLPHLLRAIDLAPDSRELRVLVDRTREKWEKVRRDLASFVAKHDHRNRAPYTDDDAASYVRAFEIAAGARGLFGNDLAAARGQARIRPAAPRGDPAGPD